MAWVGVVASFGLVLGCALAPSVDAAGSLLAPELRQAILRDARARSTVAVKIASVKRVIWRDGSLGCPRPDMMYTQALVPGLLIQVTPLKPKGSPKSYEYHAAARGNQFVYCEPGAAQAPLNEDGMR
jgi:hypothetical protein